MNVTRVTKLGVCVLIGILIWNCRIPMGFTTMAWHLFAIFAATIISFMLRPLSLGALTFIALTVAAITRTLTLADALSGFGSSIVWLIVAAFLFSRAFVKSGLGPRIAYQLTARFGGSALSLGYILALSDFIVSPAIPSNTARAGGIFFPIVRSLAESFDSRPGPTARRIGAYLIQTVYQADIVACAMTMTAMAGNVLIVTLASKVAGVSLTWGMWALAAVVPGMISMAIMPALVYNLYPPELTRTPGAKLTATSALKAMGPMRTAEKNLSAIFVLAVLGWASSKITGIDPTTVAMAAVCIMLLSNVISWEDVVDEKGAWDALVWMGGIYGLTDCLSKTGFFTAFAQSVGHSLHGLSWPIALLLLTIVYVYSTYAFASGVAHIASMYPVFLAVAVAVGAPPVLSALWLAYCSALYQGLTHYASGPSAIFFSAGYIDQPTWWRLGFLTLLFNLIVWTVVGSVWWKFLRLW